jgi:cytochrome c oxidase subunit 1
VQNSSRLALYHYWVAFGTFLPAVVLGAWQMLMRSPLPAPLDDPNAYYASVTLHGSVMAYVVTTFFAMGFGYAVTATSLGRPVRGLAAAWAGFVICLIGTVMVAVIVAAGRASVLYTFYPPLLGSAWYYLGALLLIGGSMIWVVLMIYNMAAWKREHPGTPVPLPMFAITATALLWAWAASGVEVELIGVLLPRAFGLTTQIDAGLARTLFSVTLHSIVYFWLMPAYIAFYTLVPQAAGGRLYSDTMGRLTFIMFLVFSLPVGIAPPVRRPRTRGGTQVHPVVPHLLRRAADAAHRVLDLRQPGDRRARARRARALRVDRGIAVERADDPRGRPVARDARARRVRRAHQHELRDELNDS